MKYRPYGKHVKKDINPVSVCDRTGQFFNTADLVKQMEYRGSKLSWTGLMVGKPYVDKPASINVPFKAKREMIPIKDLRLETFTPPIAKQNVQTSVSGQQLLNKISGIFSQD